MHESLRKSGVAVSLALTILLGSTHRVSAVELLTNGNFDAGSVAWVEINPQPIYPIITLGSNAGIVPQSGVYLAWLGGLLSATRSLYQTVTVPPGATGLQVHGYIWVATEESGGVYDVAALRLVSTSGVVLETLKTWSNNDAGSAWLAFSYPIVGNYVGQTVRLQLDSTCDDSFNTNFFFDTISFTAAVPTAAAEAAVARNWGSIKNMYR